MSTAQRSPEEIRASIERHRHELGTAVGALRNELALAADWRRHLVRHKREIVVGAAVAGFVVGGGIAAVGGLLRRRR